MMDQCNFVSISGKDGQAIKTSMVRQFKGLVLSSFFSCLLLLVSFGQVQGATLQLCTLLQSGGIISLSPANTYQLPDQCTVSKNVTINGNGVTVTGVGPIVATGTGITLTADHLVLNASGWAALAAVSGGHLVVRNSSSITAPSWATGLYADNGATISVQNSSISSTYIGVQITNVSAAGLHGLTVTGSPYAVLASGVGTSVTVDGNSLFDYSGAGVGVALLDGATGIIHDSTINGFTNGIDIHPTIETIYYGTVDVQNCLFDHNGSAIAASYGSNIRFATSTVTNAVTDGIYFDNSTAVVEKSQVIGSLNTGVSFVGCPDGTIQDSFVKDSVHQGVSVVAELPSTPPSLNIKVLNNTFVNNQIANLLVDDRSTAKIQGNIFAQTPDADIRFHGPKGITLDSALVIDSMSGMEIYDSTPTVLLSDISQNNKNGILIYNNSLLIAEHSLIWNNGFAAAGGTADSYSIFINTGAQVSARSCAFGPAGDWGLNNQSTASCDVASNYWDAANGPYVPSWIRPQGQPNGSGAHLDSGYQVSGAVTYLPFLTQPPVSSSVNNSVGLASGGSLGWDSLLGLSIGLTAKPGSPALSGEILGALRVNDTGSLNLVTPPDYLLQGKLYAVWISFPLRLNSLSGYLQFSLPSQSGRVALQRRGFDGTWSQVASVWDQPSHTLTYSPADPHLLNGTFAITNIPDIIYAKKDGACSGKRPCFSSVQSGIDSMLTNTVMNVTQETFAGDVACDFPEVLTLSGGWDGTYSSNLSVTDIQGSLTIKKGKLIVENVALTPQ